MASLSIPFVVGQTVYAGTVEVLGPYQLLIDEERQFSYKLNEYIQCSLGVYTLISSVAAHFDRKWYLRATEIVTFTYSFTLNPTTCKVNGRFQLASGWMTIAIIKRPTRFGSITKG